VSDSFFLAFLATLMMGWLAGLTFAAGERAKLRRLVRALAERCAGQSELLRRKANKERGTPNTEGHS
jgi:hypothetical protein